MNSRSGNAVLRDVEGKVIDRLTRPIKRQAMNTAEPTAACDYFIRCNIAPAGMST
jgi:hypothetical protein